MPSEPQQLGGWEGNERRKHPTEHEVYRYIDQQLESKSLRISSFADIYHVLSIVMVLVGGVAWGLKLESKIEVVQQEQSEMTASVQKGILPVTEERLSSLTSRLDRREQESEKAMQMIMEVQKECQRVLREK